MDQIFRSLIVDENTVDSVDWEGNYFKYCHFTGLSPDGGMIDSDFRGCLFKDLDWYWGLFSIVTFFECEFADCVFRGATFAECRFVECELTRCRFVQDNLGGECDFHGTVLYGCRISDCEGFTPANGR